MAHGLKSKTMAGFPSVNILGRFFNRLLLIVIKQAVILSNFQEILVNVIQRRPHFYYKLPCEWNMQIDNDVASECCHVIWPMRNSDQVACWQISPWDTTFRPVKLVQFRTYPNFNNGLSVSTNSYSRFDRRWTST